MTSWLILLGGLLLWALHFFGLYAIGEFGNDDRTARIAVLSLTLVVLLADAALLARMLRRPGAAGFSGWRDRFGIGGAILAALAICWQALPALLIDQG